MEVRKRFPTLIISLVLLVILICIGITGFVLIEKYSFTEALFMTIITMSTVGFREVRPLSDFGMIFTSLFIVTSFGLFAYVISSITGYILDGGYRNYFINRTVNKKIANLKNHVIVCGYGRNGKQAVRELLEHDEMVVIVEADEKMVEGISQDTPNILYIIGDATREETLERAKVDLAKALITTMPVDANNLYIVLTAREKNPNMLVISRATDEHADAKLKKAGATNVIMPDKVGGTRMAKLVFQPDIIEFLDNLLIRSNELVNLVEISCKDINARFINQSIAQLDIRNVSGANLIGIKTEEGQYIFNPSPKIKIMPEDKLFALGTKEQIDNLKNVLTQNKKL